MAYQCPTSSSYTPVETWWGLWGSRLYVKFIGVYSSLRLRSLTRLVPYDLSPLNTKGQRFSPSYVFSSDVPYNGILKVKQMVSHILSSKYLWILVKIIQWKMNKWGMKKDLVKLHKYLCMFSFFRIKYSNTIVLFSFHSHSIFLFPFPLYLCIFTDEKNRKLLTSQRSVNWLKRTRTFFSTLTT